MADFQLSTISVRRCLKCGTDIFGTHGVRKFCSTKCHDIFHGRHQEPILNCQYCGKDISDTPANQKYCSNVCKKKARTVRHGGTPRARLEPRTRPVVDGQRQCVKCDQWKPIEEFPKDKRSPVGFGMTCKRCVADVSRTRMAESRKKNPEMHHRNWLRHQQRQAENQGRVYVYKSMTLKRSGKDLDQTEKEYDRVIEQNARDAFDWWFAKKTDKQIARWYKATGKPWLNPRLSDAESFRVQYKNDPEFNAYQKMRRQLKKDLYEDGIGDLMRSNLNRGDEVRSRKIEEMLGYSMKDLRVHLERQFTKGMNWDKFSAGEIHIDHIRPKKSFDLSDYEQWKICWGLSNLQPLWAKDNLRKSARILRLL